MSAIVKSKPEDILEFCLKWFRDRKGDPNYSASAADDSEDDNDKFVTISDEDFKIRREKLLKNKKKKRVGVTSEVYGPNGRRQSIQLSKGFVKEERAHMRLLFFCANSFLFKHFSENEIGIIIKMMKKRTTTTDEIIFEEGDKGDSVYFVDEGIF